MKLFSAEELLKMKFEAQRVFCGPWFRSGEIVLLYAYRGVGKSNFVDHLGYTIANGTRFLRWPTTEASVLIADAELPMRLRQKRLAALEENQEALVLPDRFKVLSRDDHGVFPNLSTPEGQSQFERLVAPYDVVIIDNLTTACRPVDGRDDDVKIWLRMVPFLYRLRNADKLVIIIHHAGKSGQQLGTSLRENDVDIILKMTPSPEDRKTAIWLEVEKGRDLPPAEREGLYLEFNVLDGKAQWTWDNLKARRADLIRKFSRVIKSKTLLAQQLHCQLGEVVEALRGAEPEEERKHDWDIF